MVSYADIQNAYNKLYTQVSKYIWSFPVVAALADLEIAIYQTCQDLVDIRSRYLRFRGLITSVLYNDEELKEAMDNLESLIYEDSVYVKLNKVNEVIQL